MSERVQSEDVSEYNARSLRKLVRSITNSQGQFALILVRCNDTALRERVVQQLKDGCRIETQELYLSGSIKTLYSTIQARLEQKPPQVLMLFGLELAESIDQVLISTNQVREEFRKNFQFPIVLWVNSEILRAMVQLAPDFKSWAAAPIKFDLTTDELLELLQQTAEVLFADDLQEGSHSYFFNILPRAPLELKLALEDLQTRGQELSPEQQANYEFIRGRLAQFHQQNATALIHYQNSLAFWQHTQNLERQGVLLYRIAICHADYFLYWKHQSDWSIAAQYLKACIDVFERTNREELVARFISALSEALRRSHAWTELQTVAHRSLTLHQRYEPISHLEACDAIASELDQIFRPPTLLARDYGYLAEAALHQSNWLEATQFAQEALTISASLEIPYSQHQALYQFLLAESLHQQGQISEAITYLEAAKTQSDAKRDPLLHIQILDSLRSLYFKQKKYLEAFAIKQEKRLIEYEFGFQAFAGALPLKPKNPIADAGIATTNHKTIVSREIVASGRQQDVDQLVKRLSQDNYKLIIIHGLSGVGKSSLLRVGLVSTLKQHPIGDRTAVPVLVKFYTNWIGELGNRLAQALTEAGVGEVPSTEQFSLESVEAIVQQFGQNSTNNLLTILIFDQFEEFFFSYPTLAERQPFYAFLRTCINFPFVKVILSLREDYLHYLLEFERVVKLDIINNNILDKEIRYFVGNFSPDRAKQVVQALIDQSQFYLEPALIDVIVQDIASGCGDVPPIELQLIGAQLQAENITTLEQYHQIGSKNELVRRSLETVINDCGAENEQIARLVLYSLTHENGTRPLKTRSQLEVELWSLGLATNHERLSLVLEVLVGSGLVSLIPESPADRYQLFHDYLVKFVRQQQEGNLAAELKQERELRNLTEQQLRQTLRQLEKTVLEEKQLRQRAEIAEIDALSLSSQALLLSHDQLTALVAGMRAGRQLQATNAPGEIYARTVARLRQAIYTVRELNRFQGHSDWVNGVCFSPDGQSIASSSRDRTIKLWSLDGRELQTFIGHEDWVNSISFSPDGQLLVSGGGDSIIKLWNLDGQELLSFSGHRRGVRRICFSPDGQLIASGSADNTIYLWNLEGKRLKTLAGHWKEVTNLKFSPDGQLLASSGGDHTIKLWSLEGKEIHSFPVESEVLSLCFSPNGKLLVCGNWDSTISLWGLDGTLLQQLSGHSDRVVSVDFSPDGWRLASGSGDGTIKLWSLDGRILETLSGHSEWVNSVRFSPDGRRLVSGSGDRTVRLWSLEGRDRRIFAGYGDRITSMSFSPDGQILATGSSENAIKLWNLDGQEIRTFAAEAAGIESISFSPDGQHLATGGGDGQVILWNLQGQVVRTFNGHKKHRVRSVCFSPDGQFLATGSARTLLIWDLDQQTPRRFHTSWSSGRSVCFSPNGQFLAGDGGNGTVKLWSSDGRELQTFQSYGRRINSICFSPNGACLAAGSGDHGTISLWSLDGQELQTFSGHNAGITSLKFSPDGQLLASASGDRTVKLWNLDGQELQTFSDHRAGITSVRFSPSGKLLASASCDSTVILRSLDLLELDLDQLLEQGCRWLQDYLSTNRFVEQSDRLLCTPRLPQANKSS